VVTDCPPAQNLVTWATNGLLVDPTLALVAAQGQAATRHQQQQVAGGSRAQRARRGYRWTGGVDAGAATREPGTRATQGRRSAPATITTTASTAAATAQCAVADGMAGALDPARRSIVTESVVRAGGGIVWRRGEGGRVEIVLVHRPAYDDWSFPKGKPNPGKTEAQAALREVQEETGLRAGWAARSGPAPIVTPSDDRNPSATGR
jgi:hypothetical protein